MPPAYRSFLKWSRTLHIFLTLLGLLLLLFFAVTGFLLNHEEWFGVYEPQTRTMQGSLPTGLLSEPDKLMVVEKLRSDFGATGALDSFEVEEDTLRVVFKSPGRQTEASIRRAGGELEVTHQASGLLGRLADLHRGKGSGAVWSLVIDSACILLMVISLTGVILWLSLQTRRWLGLVAVTIGLTVCLAVYFVFVP